MNNLVNYNELWRILHQKPGSGGVDWDKRAHSFFKSVSGSSEAEKVINNLHLLPTDTVLDMGAGTGRFAIPIAKQAAHVTAIEPSSGMSSYLKKGMEEAGLTNYSVIPKRWEDIVIGRDLHVHDVVFASNSLGFPDLAAGLKKLNDAAGRSVHLLWFAGRERHPIEPELARRLGREDKRGLMPDYLFIVHVLHDMDIYANVQVDQVKYSHTYDDLNEATSFWTERNDISPDQVHILREYLAETLKRSDDGKLSMARTGWRARIWWEKENRAE